MGHKRNTISDEEHKKRSFVLFEKGGPQSSIELKELFFLYNDRLEPRKQDTSCSSCRAQVWQALKTYYGQ